MTESTHALWTAIGRELHADYLPTLTKPLPRELEDLIAQLVVFEFGKRGSTERSVEVLQTATIINRSVSGGQTDQMGQSS